MLKTVPLLAFLGLPAWAANGAVHEVSAPAIVGNVMPGFYNAYLYSTEPRHILTLFAPDGHELFSLPIAGRGDGKVTVESVAIDADGTLAVAWQDPPHAGIDIRESSGTLLRTIDTGRFVPAHVSWSATPGQDHSLWALGWQRDAARPLLYDQQDYATVRKYSSDGKEIGAYLPKSLFAAGLAPGMSERQARRITVTADRAGVEEVSGKLGNQREWVELELSGKLLGRWKLNEWDRFPGVAFTSDDQAYVHRYNRDTNSMQVYRLNRATSTWELVNAPNADLYGADGDKLVFESNDGPVVHLSWFPQP